MTWYGMVAFLLVFFSLGGNARAAGIESSLASGNDYAPFHEPRARERPPHEDLEEFEIREEERKRRVDRVLRRARRFLGKRSIFIDGRSFRWDCAHYLRMAYFRDFDILNYRGGPTTRSGVRRMWYFAKRRAAVHFRKTPEPGDLIFFHQTYDANGNRKADDYYTHVAIVEKTSRDGTVTYIDRAINGIARRRMNLFHPNHVRHPRTGRVVNSHVRPRRRWDEKGAKHLSAQLFAGFATVVR